MDKIELVAGGQDVVRVDKAARSITVHKPNASPGEPPKVYYFDNVFGPNSSQVRTFLTYMRRHPCEETIEQRARVKGNHAAVL